VVCAFGCLNTCVFAFVETWKSLAGTSANMELPSWNWHNEGFLSSVGNIFFLILFSLPALVVYVLHSLGQEFFTLMKSQRNENPALFGIIMYHLLSGLTVFFADTITIVKVTAKLGTFQNRSEEDEKEGKEAKKGKDKKGTETGEEEEIEDGEESEDETRPVKTGDKILAALTLFSHLAFTIDLVLLSTRNDNSATVGSCVLFGIMYFIWIAYTIKSRKMKEVAESWLLNFRLATIVHQFLFLLFFWVTLCILLLLEKFNYGFWQTLEVLSVDEPFRAFLSAVLICLIFISVAIYGVILYVHSRSMWSLDEIASLYLAAKLQAKLKEDRE